MTSNNNLPTVAHFAAYFLRRTATFVYNQITELSAYRSVVLTVHRGEEALFPFEPVYVPVKQRRLQQLVLIIEISPRGPMLPLPFSRRYFESVIEREKPAILHGHFGPTSLYLKWLKYRYQLPLVVTFHGKDATATPKRLSAKKLREMLHTPDKILVVSEHMKKQLVEYGADAAKIDVHRVGIDVGQFQFHPRELNGDKVRLLHVSGFTEKKGIPVLLRAFSKACAVDPRLHLTLVGNGPDGPKAQEMIGELGLQDQVSFLGFIPHQDVVEHYNRCHLFIHPSITASDGSMEGVPTVLMEAMATGMPVLASEHSGIPELVEDGYSGFLSPENDVEALAKNILELANRPEMWERFGSHARRKVEENHNFATQIEKLEAVYRSLTGPAHRPNQPSSLLEKEAR